MNLYDPQELDKLHNVRTNTAYVIAYGYVNEAN